MVRGIGQSYGLRTLGHVCGCWRYEFEHEYPQRIPSRIRPQPERLLHRPRRTYPTHPCRISEACRKDVHAFRYRQCRRESTNSTAFGDSFGERCIEQCRVARSCSQLQQDVHRRIAKTGSWSGLERIFRRTEHCSRQFVCRSSTSLARGRQNAQWWATRGHENPLYMASDRRQCRFLDRGDFHAKLRVLRSYFERSSRAYSTVETCCGDGQRYPWRSCRSNVRREILPRGEQRAYDCSCKEPTSGTWRAYPSLGVDVCRDQRESDGETQYLHREDWLSRQMARLYRFGDWSSVDLLC